MNIYTSRYKIISLSFEEINIFYFIAYIPAIRIDNIMHVVLLLVASLLFPSVLSWHGEGSKKLSSQFKDAHSTNIIKNSNTADNTLVNDKYIEVRSIYGFPEIIGAPECVSKVCDDAMCEVDDDRFLFEQTCNRLGKEICSTYVMNHLYLYQ